MKKTTAFILFLVLTSAAASFCAASADSSSLPLKISLALPAESLNTSDLDSRDEFNRPIKSKSFQNQLVSLWSQSLNQTLLLGLTPLRLKILSIMNSLWDGFAGRIRNTTQNFFQTCKGLVQGKKNRIQSAMIISFFSVAPPSSRISMSATGNAFSFFLHSVISSTRLLC